MINNPPHFYSVNKILHIFGATTFFLVVYLHYSNNTGRLKRINRYQKYATKMVENHNPQTTLKNLVENVRKNYEKELKSTIKPLAISRRQQNYHLRNSKKTILIGIGTGRSGTLAFSKLLDNQPNTKITHEWRRCINLDWNIPSGNPELAEKLAERRLNDYLRRGELIVGDVALWYLPYVDFFLTSKAYSNTDVKIIALKRKREDCIESFYTWFSKWRHFPWITDESRAKTAFKDNKNYDQCYPKYQVDENSLFSTKTNKIPLNQVTIRDGAAVYYDDYYEQVDKLIEKFGDEKIRVLDSYEILNNQTLQIELFKWAGINGPYNFASTMTSGHQTHKKLVHQIAQDITNQTHNPLLDKNLNSK